MDISCCCRRFFFFIFARATRTQEPLCNHFITAPVKSEGCKNKRCKGNWMTGFFILVTGDAQCPSSFSVVERKKRTDTEKQRRIEFLKGGQRYHCKEILMELECRCYAAWVEFMEFVSRRVDMITTGSVFSSRDPLITRRWKNYFLVS